MVVVGLLVLAAFVAWIAWGAGEPAARTGPTVVPAPEDAPAAADATRQRIATPPAAVAATPDVQSPPSGAAAGPDATPPDADDGREPLVVDVVDAAGAPAADVLVMLREQWDTYRWVEECERTDVAGRAVLRSGTCSGEHVIAVGVAGAEAVAARVVPGVAQAEPLRLTLPATGRVVVELVDGAGRALGGDAAPEGRVEVLLRSRAEDDEIVQRTASHVHEDEDASARSDARGGERVEVEDGRAVFARVAVASELVAYVSCADTALRTVRTEFRGPALAGEERVVRVAFGTRCPLLSGRVVDAAEQPLAGIEVRAYVARNGSTWDVAAPDGRATSGPDGRFELRLDVPEGGFRGACVELRAGHAQGESTLRRLTVPSDAALDVWDVGDLRDAAAEVVAEGVVVDPDGAPVVGATVARLREDDGIFASLWPRATTDAEGRFRIEGAAADDVLLGASSGDDLALSAPCRVPAGTRDLRLTLARCGSLDGRLSAPAGVDLGDLTVVLRGAATAAATGERDTSRGVLVRVAKDGTFRFPHLLPGTCELIVRSGWDDASIVRRVPDLRIVAGEVCRDPRLQPLDLGEGRTAVRVTVRDPDGRTVPALRVHSRASGGARWDETWPEDPAELVLLADGRGLDLVVAAPGFITQRRDAVAADTAFVLRPVPMTTVRLAVADGAPFPDASCGLSASLRWIGAPSGVGERVGEYEDPRDGGTNDATFRSDRTLTLSVWEPGRYAVALVLWDDATGADVACDPEPTVVEVRGDGRPVDVVVRPDAASFAEALADVRDSDDHDAE